MAGIGLLFWLTNGFVLGAIAAEALMAFYVFKLKAAQAGATAARERLEAYLT